MGEPAKGGQGKPLDEIEGFPASVIEVLRKYWITTAEELIRAVPTPEKSAELAGHLGLTEEEMRTALDRARSALPEKDVLAIQEEPPRQYPMGAWLKEPPERIAKELEDGPEEPDDRDPAEGR